MRQTTKLSSQLPEINRETQKLLKESSLGTPSKEQYDRMHRWFEKLEKINNGIPHEEDSRHYQDILYAFFQNCYHLKDWIQKDQFVPSNVKAQLEEYITDSDALSLAADICNASKHAQLTKSRNPLSQETLDPHQMISMKFGTVKPTISVSYKLKLSDETELDAFNLASKCLAEWETFFIKNRLK